VYTTYQCDILLIMPTPEQRDYYARRARDIRDYAAKATNPEIKETLETMARSYDALVEAADRIVFLRSQVDI